MSEATIIERGDFWHPDPEQDKKLGGPGPNQRAKEDRAAASKPKEDPKKLRKGESYMDYSKRQKAAKSGTAASRLNKLGANIKPKERKRDKVGKALGKLLDRAAGLKTEGLRSSVLSDRKAMNRISDDDRKNSEQDARMKYGKRWKEFTSDTEAAKNRLRPGEVKKFNKKSGKWESNKD
jgi:hypothetical protein